MSGAYDDKWISPQRRCARDESGGVAVEFAIVVLPFVALVLAIMELALDYILFSQVDYVTTKSQVSIRSGEVTLQKLDAATFKKDHLCPHLTMLPCGPLVVNVLTVQTWWDSTGWVNAGAWSSSNVNPSSARFCPGGSADIVFIQVAYPIPFASFIWSGDKSAADGKRYYLTTTAFRNDPYGVPANTRAGC